MLKAPFPYAGGKAWIAGEVWQRLGADVTNYVEPCCGSAAMLLARPQVGHIETINDLDGFVTNAYRAIQWAPEDTAAWSDWPVSEQDLHARHLWLLSQRETLTARLAGNPDYYDPKSAGWWIWGACCWIGGGWCSGRGPWQAVNGCLELTEAEGIRRQLPHLGDAGQGIHRKLPHLGNAGRGIHRKLPHLGNAGRGIRRKLPHLGDAGQGIHRQLPHLGDAGQGILDYFTALAVRLRRVRITCGDWQRVLGPSVTWRHHMTGIFLDPPYPDEQHNFGYVAGGNIWEDCWAWACDHGSNPLLRIVLCGYDDGRTLPDGWRLIRWKARGGYGSQGQGQGRLNAQREVLYCSPHCLVPTAELSLFAWKSQEEQRCQDAVAYRELE